MENKIKKRYIVFYASIALLLVSITSKFSYAFFVAAFDIDGEVYQTVIQTGDLKMQFLDAQYIDNNEMSLIGPDEVATKAEKSTFKVKNTGNIDAYYDLNLNITLTRNLISNDFKWELLRKDNNDEYVTVLKSNFSGITIQDEAPSATTVIKLNNTSFRLEPNKSDSFIFRVWLEETNQNQIGLTEGNFTGNVSLQAIAK